MLLKSMNSELRAHDIFFVKQVIELTCPWLGIVFTRTDDTGADDVRQLQGYHTKGGLLINLFHSAMPSPLLFDNDLSAVHDVQALSCRFAVELATIKRVPTVNCQL